MVNFTWPVFRGNVNTSCFGNILTCSFRGFAGPLLSTRLLRRGRRLILFQKHHCRRQSHDGVSHIHLQTRADGCDSRETRSNMSEQSILSCSLMETRTSRTCACQWLWTAAIKNYQKGQEINMESHEKSMVYPAKHDLKWGKCLKFPHFSFQVARWNTRQMCHCWYFQLGRIAMSKKLMW